jgi:hypothetical protein
MPLYESLTKTSTPDEIAAAYKEYAGGAGGDTAANQQQATAYLQNLGVAAPVVNQAYNQYLQPAVASADNMGLQSLGVNAQNQGVNYTAPVLPAVTDAQFASYIKNNNLSGIGLQEAASVFGIGQDQLLRAQKLLASNDPSIKAASDAYAAQIAGRPDLAKQNLGIYDPSKGIGSAVGVDDLYTGMLGTNAKQEEIDYWKNLFGDSVDADEREQFRKSYATDINKLFGVTGDVTAPTAEGILSGFKYAKNMGLSEDALRKTLGEDAFKKYKTGFADYAKTGIANILDDKKLSFDEAKEVVKFGREYGYDNQKLADLTGQKKEFFDTINKTYDETTNKIVDSVLGSEDVKTDGDRILRALALQQRYGFTDDDLAKATDFTPAQVKGYLEPVREYSTKYKEVMTKPDVSGKDILSFLEESKKNQNVSSAYGSNIDQQIARLNELNEKWTGFKDGYQAENIYNQINKITEAVGGKNWTGSWRSGGDNATKETVRLLMDKGVDNLSDLGVERQMVKQNSSGNYYNGQLVHTDENGRKYVAPEHLVGSFPESYTYLPPDAKIIPATTELDAQDNEITRPLNEEELKTYDPKTNEFYVPSPVKNLIDKSTGKVVASQNLFSLGLGFAKPDPNKFVLNKYETGNFLKGKSKELGIMMTDEGIPVPYQTTQKEGLVYDPAFPIFAGLLLPGIGSAISGALPGAAVAATGAAEGAFMAGAAPTMANTIATNAIMGGGVAGLTGQDVLKGAFFGGIGAPLSAGISSLLPAGLNPAMAQALTSGGTGVVKGLLQGGDFEDLLGQGVLSGLTSYGLGEVTKGLNLTPQQLNFATGIAAPLLQGQKINPMNLIGSLTTPQQQATKVTP